MDIPPIAQAIREKIYLLSRAVPTCGYSRTDDRKHAGRRGLGAREIRMRRPRDGGSGFFSRAPAGREGRRCHAVSGGAPSVPSSVCPAGGTGDFDPPATPPQVSGGRDPDRSASPLADGATVWMFLEAVECGEQASQYGLDHSDLGGLQGGRQVVYLQPGEYGQDQAGVGLWALRA